MPSNIKLIVAYDGKDYFGWQKTTSGPSVEECLEIALKQILQENIQLQAASRTDAGVHANGQIVQFLSSRDSIDFDKLKASLNSLLPKDIVVLEAQKVPEDFHPTLDCVGKEYHFHLCNSPAQMPFQRFYSWHYPYALDVEEMRQASKFFLGQRDFAAMCNTKKNEVYSCTVRDVTRIDIIELPENRIRFEIEGKSFLYKMVRNIVGSLVYVGCQKIRKEDLPAILASNDRTKAGVTAPAHGLVLHKVFFEK